jgi:hypothetical protein
MTDTAGKCTDGIITSLSGIITAFMSAHNGEIAQSLVTPNQGAFGRGSLPASPLKGRRRASSRASRPEHWPPNDPMARFCSCSP